MHSNMGTSHLFSMAFLFWLASPVAQAVAIEAFFGHYQGVVDTVGETGPEQRVMTVTIRPAGRGFAVSWSSEKHKPNGKVRRKQYSIDFVRSQRRGVYASAMRKDMFGKPRPLDPLKGDPYVWATLAGDALTVNLLLISESGSFEMQVYERTLTKTGMALQFSRLRNGQAVKTISAILRRRP